MIPGCDEPPALIVVVLLLVVVTGFGQRGSFPIPLDFLPVSRCLAAAGGQKGDQAAGGENADHPGGGHGRRQEAEPFSLELIPGDWVQP